MTTWTKVHRAPTLAGKVPRTVPGVSRGRTGFQTATLILPIAMVADNTHASVYSDGNGKLAFALGTKGEFRVTTINKSARCKRVAIPKQFARLIPFGTQDAELIRDGDMLVLDTKQFVA